MNISQGLLPFQLIQDTSKVLLTCFGGLPLVMETFRALGLRESIRKHLCMFQRSGKYEEADYVESFISVFAAGGDCVDDFEKLRADKGLKKLGLRVPSAESVRWFLNVFHEDEPLQGRLPHEALIPEETGWLKGLRAVLKELIRKAVRERSPSTATIDLDATVIESHKREAYWTYLGDKGYQPVIAYWAEEDLLVADQFRDGNVPAGMDLLPVLQEAISALPSTVCLIRVRSDAAAYRHDLLNWCRKEIQGRPRIQFAISAEVTEELRAAIQALPEGDWKPLRKVTDQGWIIGRKEWAEVEFVPSQPSRQKKMTPDRYLAIRIRPAQGELFEDGTAYRYFAVVTNMWDWDGERLLRWQRERCGTVEKVHDVLKNDLAGGVLPAKRFFANAAWWRLNVLAYNVLAVMKREALPQAWWPVRLKALRYHLLTIAARVIEHGRSLFLKIPMHQPSFLLYQEARKKLVIFSSA
jgi:hypothetical protein